MSNWDYGKTNDSGFLAITKWPIALEAGTLPSSATAVSDTQWQKLAQWNIFSFSFTNSFPSCIFIISLYIGMCSFFFLYENAFFITNLAFSLMQFNMQQNTNKRWHGEKKRPEGLVKGEHCGVETKKVQSILNSPEMEDMVEVGSIK